MSTISKILLILGLISVLTSSLTVNDYLWNDSYYHFMEISFSFYLLSFFIVTSKGIKYNKFWRCISFTIFLFSLSTIFDELFYDATKVEFNDFVRFLSILFFVVLIKKRL